jgi:O-antigen ligase
MNTTALVQQWASQLDRRVFALGVGAVIGILGGGIGLLMAVAGPIITLGAVLGTAAGLYVLTDVRVALYAAMASLLLLPFGTLPFRIGLTPTFLDITLGTFVLVYLIRRMTRQHTGLRLTPVHALIGLYTTWLIFAFVLGFQYGNPTATNLRQFAEMLLAISMTVVLVDLIRESATLRRLMLVIMLLASVQAVAAIILFALPDTTAESLLVRLGRIGYPDGGVIRYIESNPALGERAIGTWVDPNAFGSIMAISAVLIAPQLFASRPVLRPRWLAWGSLAATGVALYLTNSRASFLALALGLLLLVLLRYRQYLPMLAGGSLLFLLLPQTQRFIDRIFQAFQGEDLSTQMRIGEWTDALELISRYPLTGIGFTGRPFRNVYTDVANMYLIMANQIGITGVILFLVAMGAVFAYGWYAYRAARADESLEALHLGLHLGLMTALINAVADLYFFRLDFQSSITWFWCIVALCIASSHLARQTAAPATRHAVLH